ncbi:FKBP-type 16 kDa peptidyl-prolyl cis-trans isomerase [Candidatus Calditenuaceae archaeon HR02]|nr:FKBP-type 16 kDa peptidyl-prolyl cis-trans isomerase [Candidatus Calditenuaceae archaeon HR02]
MSGEEREGAEPQTGTEEELRVAPGSFVELDLLIRVKDTGELVDSTIEEEARKAGWTGGNFRPRLTIVGKGYLLKSIEDELINMKVSEHKVFELPPERAFGARDPSKVRVIPLRRFKDVDQPLTPGMRVIVDGREGYIRSIESGRVQVDFNHRLAGKTLVSEVWIRRILTDERDKILGVVKMLFPEATDQNTHVEVSKPEVSIRLPKESRTVSGIQLIKQSIAREIFENIEGVTKVTFVDEYLKEEG